MTVRVYKNGSWRGPDLIQVRDNFSWNQVDAAWRYTDLYGWRQIYPNVTEPNISITSITTTQNSATIYWDVSESTSVLVGVYNSSNQLIFFTTKDGSSPNSQTVTGLTVNQTYRASLTANSNSGLSFTVEQTFTVIQQVPTSPLNVTASNNRVDGILISWTAPTNSGASAITSYEIQRRTDPGNFNDADPWTNVGNVLSHVADDPNLSPSPTVYYFKVRAVNSFGAGTSSLISNAGSKIAATEVDLAANRTTINRNDFTSLVARIKNNGVNVNAPNIPITFTVFGNGYFDNNTSLTQITINSNANGQATVNYYGGSTIASNLILASTPGLVGGLVYISVIGTIPSAPTNFIGVRSSSGASASFSWSAPLDTGGYAISEYQFQRTQDSTPQEAWNTNGTSTTRTTSDLVSSIGYYFRVRAVNTIGPGPYAEIFLPAPTVPGAPQNFTASSNANGSLVTLNWSAPASDGNSAITSYEFQRNQDPNPRPDNEWISVGNTTSTTSSTSSSTSYYFRVRARNVIGAGNYAQTFITTNAASPSPSPSPIPPTEPPGVTPLPPTSPPRPPIPPITPPSPRPPGPIIPMPPPGQLPVVSIGSGTPVLTVNGYVPIENVLVGDQLVSIDIEEVSTEGSTVNLDTWSSETFTNNGFSITTVTDVFARRISGPEYIINDNSFSDNHDILTLKDGVYSFQNAKNIDTSYQVFDYDIQDWTPVTSVEVIENSTVTVYSIDCEPYDVFFTNNALVYNRKEFM